MNKRIAIITGAYGAIGKAIARELAKDPHHELVLIGRNQAALQTTTEELSHNYPHTAIRSELVDLSSCHSIRSFRDAWEGPLHIIINNAATTPRQRSLSSEGVEMQWATNVMGYFWMMLFMSEFMKGQHDPRIVNVASYWAGGLDLGDVEFKKRHYDNDVAYRQSKQADRMLAVVFARKLASYGIAVNACHPGDVNSKLSNALGFGGHESPAQGAATPVWLATSHKVQAISGKYFEHNQQTICPYSTKASDLEDLYNLCLDYIV